MTVAEPASAPPVRSLHARRELALCLGLIALAAAAAALIAGRTWQVISIARPRPLGAILVNVSGKTLYPATTGLAVVALASLVAVLAAGVVLRRLIGVVLVACGLGLAWIGLLGSRPVSRSRAISIAADAHSTVGVDPALTPVQVSVHAGWGVALVLAAVALTAAGVAIVLRAPRWRTMSSRYEAPVGANPDHVESDVQETSEESAQRQRVARDIALWNSLDRGEDPTV